MTSVLRRDNIVLLLIGFSVFLLLNSKQIILYNEEILVAIAFFLFLGFSVQNFSQTLADMLDDRSKALKGELNSYFQSKEALLTQSIEEHTSRLGQTKVIQKIGIDSFLILALVVDKRYRSISSLFLSQTQQKLKNLWISKKSFQQELQFIISSGFRSAVLEKYQKSKGSMKPIFLAEAFNQLSKD
jgi:hypothetical protein